MCSHSVATHQSSVVPLTNSNNSANWLSRSSKVDDFHLIWKGLSN